MTLEQRVKMLERPAGRIDMVLDTDAYNEIDDQFAISYALRAKDKMTVQALYAAPFHNSRSTGPKDGMEKSYQEIEKLLKLAGEETPVFRGSERYLLSETEAVDSPAARDLARRAMEYTPDQPLYVAAIGAITNVASAILMNPAIAERIVLVWLGGHALEWPDTNEFNMKQDVAAARVAFGCGAPLVMLPCMGVVSSLRTTGPELDYWLKDKNPLSDYLCRQASDEANSYAAGKPWSRVIWDVSTIAWLVDEDSRMTSSRLEPTPIPEYDNHYGRDPRRPLCRYVYDVNRDRIFEDLFARLTR